MKNIDKIAGEILKEALDQSTVRGIKILWKQYYKNIKEFSRKLRDLIKRNRLDPKADKGWLLKVLNQITGEDWVVSANDFVMASQMNMKK